MAEKPALFVVLMQQNAGEKNESGARIENRGFTG